MHEIRSVGVLSAAKVMGALYFIMGEVAALFFALAVLLQGHPGRALLILIFFGAIQGVIGFVASAVLSWLYNRIAGRIGGIELHLVSLGS
jgi:hypothetical protein